MVWHLIISDFRIILYKRRKVHGLGVSITLCLALQYYYEVGGDLFL